MTKRKQLKLSVGRSGQHEEGTRVMEGVHRALEDIMVPLQCSMAMASILDPATPMTATSLRIPRVSVATKMIPTEGLMAGVTT